MSEEFLGSITDVIQAALAANGDIRMITKSVIIFESMNQDGEKSIIMLPGDEVAPWDLIAFGGYADEMGRLQLREMTTTEEEDEDGD